MAEYRPAQRASQLPPNFWGAMDREIARLSAEPGPRMIDVSKGNPDLPTPAHIVSVMQGEVDAPRNHRYPAYLPRPSVRDAIVRRYREDYGVAIDPDHEVAIFHGSHEGIMAGVLSLADPGSTIVLPDPGYPMYRSAALLAGAEVVDISLAAPTFQPDFDAVRNVSEASVLILNYPNNPTGALARPETFERAIEFAGRTGAAFIHDFAYASLGFGGQRPLSALEIDRGHEHTVEVQTLSKTYSMAGWRFGYAVGNASIIQAMRAYQAHAFSTIFGATQEAAAAALDGDQQIVRELTAIYERRRDLLVEGLRALGWEVSAPEGTFFVWARVPGVDDDVAFADRLRSELRIGVAPGSGFGPGGRGYVRLGLVSDDATLAELIERIAADTATQTH